MSIRAAPPFPPGLYAVCDDTILPERPLLQKAAALLDGGVRVMQLRAKRTPLPRLVALASELATRCRERGCTLLVNDRVDVALLAGADGVHLGDEDLPAKDARTLLGPGKLIGVTARSVEAVRAAAADGADYAGVGPVFRTTTKVVDAEVMGVEGLARLCAGAPLPVVAISGITLENIAQVAGAGAWGAAVVSDLLGAPDVAARARALSAAFEAGRATLRHQR